MCGLKVPFGNSSMLIFSYTITFVYYLFRVYSHEEMKEITDGLWYKNGRSYFFTHLSPSYPW
jgi:hypothetical protein